MERQIGEIFCYKNAIGVVETWQCVAAISDNCSGCWNGGPDICKGCEFPSCDSTDYPPTIKRKIEFGACSKPLRKDKHNVIFKRINSK